MLCSKANSFENQEPIMRGTHSILALGDRRDENFRSWIRKNSVLTEFLRIQLRVLVKFVLPVALAIGGLLFSGTSLLAQEQKAATKSKRDEPQGLTKYLGRRIAQPMSYMHMNWLNRPERLKEENPQEMLEQLGLKDGLVVCDLGAGDGYHTLQMAPRVGPKGKVIAVDIQPEMLQELSRKLAEKKFDNVETVLGELWDPKLQDNTIDLVLMVDVYHEFSHPVQMLAALRKALKSDGLIALVEFRAEDPTVAIKPEHKMTKVQILKEYKANGFKLAKEYERLPWQHLMFLQPDPNWAEKP